MFSIPPNKNLNFSVTFILSSANAFNLDQSKFFHLVKGLQPSSRRQNSILVQTEMYLPTAVSSRLK